MPILGLVVLALGMRLLVWRWHQPYPLGGDETEYFNQALTLLREHRYVELKLMRPPLYTIFLAACIFMFDSLVQRLRLVQELISALTIVPVYALTRQLFGERRVALVAALLAAASYTLADNATELLTETLFLFGLTTLFWLLLKARSPGSARSIYALLAGLSLGALVLLRSVALPLLPLGALWLLIENKEQRTENKAPLLGMKVSKRTSLCSLLFVLCSLLVILPWTIRNELTYGAPILVDTTGPENLWLDNDPAGREAVKRQLYALGDDRAERQRIALNRGVAAITADPRRFLAKAWGEAQRFFALQYFDDLRDRPAIWVPPLEVWLRLLAGDGLWLALLLGGAAGLWLVRFTIYDLRFTIGAGNIVSPKWLFVPWALYTLLTAVVFHVELRYRLPLYPVLLPYAAWSFTRQGDKETRRQGDKETGVRGQGAGVRGQGATAPLPPPAGGGTEGGRSQGSDVGERTTQNSKLKTQNSPSPLHPITPSPAHAAALLTCLALAGLTLLHRPYIGEAWALAWKHADLWRTESALAVGDAAGADAAAHAALGWDGDSALARVALARAALTDGDRVGALRALDDAIAALPAHPYAHLLRGAIEREQGQTEAARADLAYETASLEDLQRWSWGTFAPVAPARPIVEVGGGLDLGYVRGFSAPEADGFRWSGDRSEIMLAAPGGPARLSLRLAPGRPGAAPQPTVVVLLGDREVGRLQLAGGWRTYTLPVSQPAGPVVLTLRADTFRPRDYDPASPDSRALGVMVGRVAIEMP